MTMDLTEEEITVLNLYAKGWRDFQVADEMGIPPSKVLYHRRLCIIKLNTTSFIGAVAKAVQLGIIYVGEQKPQEGFSFENFFADCCEWSEKTFGPKELPRTASICNHIKLEVEDEILPFAPRRAPALEWIGLILLSIDGAYRAGCTYELLVLFMRRVLAVNKMRNWPDWRTMPEDAPIEHIRTKEEKGDV